MNTTNDKDLTVGQVILLFIALVGTIVIIGYSYEKFAGCPGRAAGQGLTGEYGIVQGCVFTLPDGKKVNETHYRVL